MSGSVQLPEDIGGRLSGAGPAFLAGIRQYSFDSCCGSATGCRKLHAGAFSQPQKRVAPVFAPDSFHSHIGQSCCALYHVALGIQRRLWVNLATFTAGGTERSGLAGRSGLVQACRDDRDLLGDRGQLSDAVLSGRIKANTTAIV